MISRELMHRAVQRLQGLMSCIDMIEEEETDEQQKLWIGRSRQMIRDLTDMLNSEVEK